MNHAWTNLTVPAEITTGTVLILLAVVVKGMRNLFARLSKSRLTLETDSFALTLQTPQDSSPQELAPHDLGGNDDGRSKDDDGGIPATHQRPKW